MPIDSDAALGTRKQSPKVSWGFSIGYNDLENLLVFSIFRGFLWQTRRPTLLPQEILHKSHEIIHRHLKHSLLLVFLQQSIWEVFKSVEAGRYGK